MIPPAVQDVLERLRRDGTAWRASRHEERRYSNIWLLRPESTQSPRPTAETLESISTATDRDVTLVLKLYRSPSPERRQREFDDLKRVFDALGPGAGVVRPVACYPDIGAIVTLQAVGRPLGGLVREACRHGAQPENLARAAALCTAAGSWLRAFQAHGVEAIRGRVPDHLGAPEPFLAYVDERLRILRSMRSGIEPALHARLVAHAASALQLVPPRAWESVTWSHSDFGPHNLLADGDRVTVLDFELAPQHPCFDAAYFIEGLVHAAGPWAEATRVRRLVRAFLAGWGVSADPALFALFRLRHLACSYVSEARRGGIAQLRAWPGLRLMRQRLRRFPDELSPRVGARAA